MAEYRYGTNFTSVKVKYAPGGQSSINLGWDDPKPSSFKPDMRNIEKRSPIPDPFKYHEPTRNNNDRDEFNIYDKVQRNFSQQPAGFFQAKDPTSQSRSPFQNKRNDDYPPAAPSLPESYNQYKEDDLIPPEFRLPQSYFKSHEPENNYLKFQKASQKDLRPSQPKDLYQVPQYGPGRLEPEFNYFKPPADQGFYSGVTSKDRPLDAFSMPEENYYKPQGYSMPNYAKEPPNQYVLPPKYPSSAQKKIYQPPDNFEPFRRPNYSEEKKYAADPNVKNSVRVSNPPGGRSTFTFG
jgi:hypothetical protein